jgi:hypothetical protein
MRRWCTWGPQEGGAPRYGSPYRFRALVVVVAGGPHEFRYVMRSDLLALLLKTVPKQVTVN